MFANHSLSLLTNDLCCVISILLCNYFRVFYEFYGRFLSMSYKDKVSLYVKLLDGEIVFWGYYVSKWEAKYAVGGRQAYIEYYDKEKDMCFTEYSPWWVGDETGSAVSMQKWTKMQHIK